MDAAAQLAHLRQVVEIMAKNACLLRADVDRLEQAINVLPCVKDHCSPECAVKCERKAEAKSQPPP